MKFTWEPNDLTLGMEICRNNTRYIIGYYVGISTDQKYCLIDTRDGAVLQAQTKQELAAMLNAGGYIPRYEYSF